MYKYVCVYISLVNNTIFPFHPTNFHTYHHHFFTSLHFSTLHFFSLLFLFLFLFLFQYPSNPPLCLYPTTLSIFFSLPHLAGIFCRPTLFPAPPPLYYYYNHHHYCCYRSVISLPTLHTLSSVHQPPPKKPVSLPLPKMNPHQQNKVDVSVSFVACHLLWAWVEELTSSSFVLK